MPPARPVGPTSASDLTWLDQLPFLPAGPVRDFLAYLEREAAQLRTWMPDAPVASALEHARARLVEDLRAAWEDEVWLTVSEAAALARSSPDAVRVWIRKEKVRALRRPGGSYLVERRSLVLALAVAEARRVS